jgi:hypothetical protein
MARTDAARTSAGVLGACLLALIDDEDDADIVDRRAAAVVLAETLIMWRRSVTR